MGMLFRMFAPKPLKKAAAAGASPEPRTARPVKRAKVTAVNATHPVGASNAPRSARLSAASAGADEDAAEMAVRDRRPAYHR